jgi:integrase
MDIEKIKDVRKFFKRKQRTDEFSEPSVKLYKWALRKFLEFFDYSIPYDADKINNFLFDYEEKSKSSSRQIALVLKSFYTFLKQRTIAGAIYLPRVRRKEIEVLDLDAIRKIIENEEFDFEMRCILALMISSGLRISEALRLKVSDIDISEKQGKVLSKGKKPKEKKDVFVFSETAKNILQRQIGAKGKNECLFPNQNYQKVWKYFTKKFGFRTHLLRHTFITELARTLPLTDVQVLARHGSTRTTERYVNPNKARAIKEYHKKEVV